MNRRGAMFLALLAAAAGFALSLVYQATLPVIKQHLRLAEEVALREVLPGANGYRYREDLTNRGAGGEVQLLGVWEGVPTGAVFLLDSPGYAGPIRVMVGVRGGVVVGLRVVDSARETPGLGARVRESWFAKAFLGKSDIGEVEGIASATISSQAVLRAAQTALTLDKRFFRR